MKHKRTASKSRIRRTKKSPVKFILKKSVKRNPKKALVKRKIRHARPIHKRILLHPISVLVLLCAGVFIVGWTYQVVADSYEVTAVVEAAPLTQGAVITYPSDGATLQDSPINVTGTCPVDSYVKLYRNNTFSGVAWCANDGSFQIETDLFSGENTLLTEDFNVTDQQGPGTPPITVTYNPVVPPTPSPAGPSETSSTAKSGSAQTKTEAANSTPPLLLTSDFHYQTVVVGDTFSWNVDVGGGVPPYKLHILWGDGQSSNMQYNSDPIIQISHTYKRQGYYAIKITSTDSSGATSFLQLAAMIKLPGAAGIITPNASGTSISSTVQNGLGSFFFNAKKWLWIAWPSFIVVLLMIFSYWLGERQEYHAIFDRKPSPRHRFFGIK